MYLGKMIMMITDEDETFDRQPFPIDCFFTSLAPPCVAALTAHSWLSFIITTAVLHAVSLLVFWWLVISFKCMNEAFTC